MKPNAEPPPETTPGGLSPAASSSEPPLPGETEVTPGLSEARYQARQLEARAARGDEAAARGLVAMPGVLPAGHTAEDVEVAVRTAMQPRLAATPSGLRPISLGSSPAAQPLEAPPTRPFEEPRDGACGYCHCTADTPIPERWVRIGSPGRNYSILCPKCIPIEARLATYGVPRRYVDRPLSAMEKLPGKTMALALAESWDCHRSVVIHSRDGAGDELYGTGKTQTAVLLVRRAVEAGLPAKFVSSIAMIERIKDTFDEHSDEKTRFVINELATVQVLVIDDLGAERPTDWTRERIRDLIDRRYSAERTTVITTNMTSWGELAESLGGAVASRLREAVWVPVGGKDMRAVS